MIVSVLENTTQYGAIDVFPIILKEKAIGEYQEFNKNQKIVSDFDKEIRRIKGDSDGKKQQ